MEIKLSFILTFLFVTGFAFVVASNYAKDLNVVYPEENNLSLLVSADKYQYLSTNSSLTDSFYNLENNTKKALSPNEDFFTRIIGGASTLIALPFVVLQIVGTQIVALPLLSSIYNDFLVDFLGIDPRILLLISTFIGVASIVTLIRWLGGRSGGA